MSCLHCDIERLLEASIPDSDFQDLIEWAFLEEQIDGETQDLAYHLLAVNDLGEQ